MKQLRVGIRCIWAGGEEYKYPWKDMEIGDYFVANRTIGCLQSAAYSWAKRNYPERRFKVVIIKQLKVKGLEERRDIYTVTRIK